MISHIAHSSQRWVCSLAQSCTSAWPKTRQKSRPTTSIAAASKKTFLQPSSGSWRQKTTCQQWWPTSCTPGSEKLGCYALMLLLLTQPNLHKHILLLEYTAACLTLGHQSPLPSAKKHFPSGTLLTHSLTFFQYLLKVTFSKILSLAILINWSCFPLSASLSTYHQSVYNLLLFSVNCFSLQI